MSTARYQFTVTDERTLAPIAGMDIYVYDQATGMAATMTDDLGQPLTNPLVTDTFGVVAFNAVQSLYRADFILDGRLRYKESNIVVGDSDVVLKGAPPAATRAGKFLAYDADGNPVASTGTGADAGLRADLAASTGATLVDAGNFTTPLIDDGLNVKGAMESIGTNLAASGGSGNVGFIQSGTGSTARTAQAKMRDMVSAKDFGATGDGTTNDAAAIAAALTYAASFTDGATVILPAGVYSCGSTSLTVPAKVNLVLQNARIVSSAANAIVISLGSDSASGKVSGTGHAAAISHTGTGYGIAMNGAGESRANVFIENIKISGSSSGAAGVYATVFNRLTMDNVKIEGYTAGSGFLNNGANAVTLVSCSFETNLHGVSNASILSGGNTYSGNAVMAFGCHFAENTGWAWREIDSGGSTPNATNAIIGCTFENNGVNGSATTGHVFAEYSDSLSIIDSYFEDYAGTAPTNAVLIGATGIQSTGTSIRGCFFATSGTNVINSDNGQSVWIDNCYAAGAGTNFAYQGANGRLMRVRNCLAPARSNLFGGFDNGADTIIDSAASTLVNSHSNTIRGYGFNSISGLAQDLVIRTRGGGTNCVTFQAADGTGIGSMTDGGAFNASTEFRVAGTKVVGTRGAALPSDATDLASVITLANAIKARMKATGGHGLVAD